ncbi:hypothetical protein EYF80_066066 [Liparis tanakae]|uniref:Uncharacterized protein n=1 Tax=Liparis tanakae TaxID=230148 RepID=A0A4Z2E4Y9_9TELE|nr:hypothetical protein EYF80_066066 [Liparis tanakae]
MRTGFRRPARTSFSSSWVCVAENRPVRLCLGSVARSRAPHPLSLNLSTSSIGLEPPIRRICLRQTSEQHVSSWRPGGQEAGPGAPEMMSLPVV